MGPVLTINMDGMSCGACAAKAVAELRDRDGNGATVSRFCASCLETLSEQIEPVVDYAEGYAAAACGDSPIESAGEEYDSGYMQGARDENKRKLVNILPEG